MISETAQPTTDLLALKTQEYANYPGLVLGLDGWVLRSIPPRLRRTFFENYEKTLRVVFHPDRYQDQAQKLSREQFLQHISEAIDYLCASEANFDLSTDFVPTRKNPIVQLQLAVEKRDEIINRIHAERTDESTRLVELEKELSKTKMQLSRDRTTHIREMGSAFAIASDLRRSVIGVPVPIAFQKYTLSASKINTEALTGTLTGQTLRRCVTSLTHTPEQQTELLRCLRAYDGIQQTRKLVLRNGKCAGVRIHFGMTWVSLIEWLKKYCRYPAKLEDQSRIESALTYLLQRKHDEWHSQTAPFLNPFVLQDNLMMASDDTDTFSLWLITKVESQMQMMAGLRHEVSFLAAESSELRVAKNVATRRVNSLTRQLKKAQEQLTKLKQEMKRRNFPLAPSGKVR